MDVEYLEEYEDVMNQMYDGGMDYDEADLLKDFENHQRIDYNELIDTNNSFISYNESLATDTVELLNKNKSIMADNEVKVKEFVRVNNDAEIIEKDNDSKIVSIRLPENYRNENGSLKKNIEEEKSKSSQILDKILGKCESKTTIKKKIINDNKNSNNLSSYDSHKNENNFDNTQQKTTIIEDNKNIILPEFINTLDFVDCGSSYKIVNDLNINFKPSSSKQNIESSIKSEIKENPTSLEKFIINDKITKNNIPEKSLSINDNMTSIKHSIMKNTTTTTTTTSDTILCNKRKFSINETDRMNNIKNQKLTRKQSLCETIFTKISKTSDNIIIPKNENTTTEIFLASTKPLLDHDNNSQNNSIKNNVKNLTKSNSITNNISSLSVSSDKIKKYQKSNGRKNKFLIKKRIVNSPGLKMFNNNKITVKTRKQIKNSTMINEKSNQNNENSLKMKSKINDKKSDDISKIKIENNNDTLDKSNKLSTIDIQMKNENNDKQKIKRKKLKIMVKRLKIEKIKKLQKCINIQTDNNIEMDGKCTKTNNNNNNNKKINRKRKIDEISNVKEIKKEIKENNISKLNTSKFNITKRSQRIRKIKNIQQEITKKLPNKSQNVIKTTLVQPVTVTGAAETTTTTTTATTTKTAVKEQIIPCSDSNTIKTTTIQGNKSILSQRRRKSKKQTDSKVQMENNLAKQQKLPQIQQLQPQQPQQKQKKNQINKLHSTSLTNTKNSNILMYEIPSYLFVETNFLSRNAYEKLKNMENFNENVLLQTTTKTPTTAAPTSTTTLSNIKKLQTKTIMPSLPIPDKQTTIKRTIIEKRNIEIILDDIDEIIEKQISKQVKNKLQKISEGFTINNENTIKQQNDNVKCKKELILENSEFNMENLNKILKFLKIYFRTSNSTIEQPLSTTTTTTTTITTSTTATATTTSTSASSLSSSKNTNINQINNDEFRFRKITLPSTIITPTTTSSSSKIVSVNLNSNEEIILPDNLINNYQKIINNNSNNAQQNSIILPNSKNINTNTKKFLTSTPISKYQSEIRKISSTIITPISLVQQQNIPLATATITTASSSSLSTTITNKQAPPILAVAPILSSLPSSSSSSSVCKTNNSDISLGHIVNENEMLITDNDITHNNTNTNISLLSTIQNDLGLESSSSSSSSLSSPSSTLTTINDSKCLKTETEKSLEDNKHKLTPITSTTTTTTKASTTSLKNNYNKNCKPTPSSSSSSLSSSTKTKMNCFKCQKCDCIERSRPLMQDHIQKVHFKNSNNCFICHVPLKSNYLQHFMLNHSNTTK